MPLPTEILSFGEQTDSSNIFAKVLLDDYANLDVYGQTLSQFLVTERVYILVHVGSGAVVSSIKTSYGGIVNASSPREVTRNHTEENLVFKSVGETKQLAFYPMAGIDPIWEGRTASLIKNGRTIECTEGARIVKELTYNYRAYQFILEIPNTLVIPKGEPFTVEVSFKLEN